MKHDKLTGRAFALTFSLSALWGGNPVAVKSALQDCPPLRLGLYRFLIGLVVVLTVAFSRKRSLSIARNEWMPLAGLGLLFSSQVVLMNLGQARTSAGHAAVIMSAYPLWTAVFAHFFVPGDKLTRTRVLGAVVAYSGVFVVFGASLRAGSGASLVGDGILVVSALLLGARQVVISRSSQRIAIDKLMLTQAVFGVILFGLLTVFFEVEPTIHTQRLWAALLYQGVVIAGFAFFVQAWLLKNYPPSRVTTVYLTQPLFGVFFSWLVLGESVGPELYMGAPLVIAGSYFVQRGS